MKRCYAYSLSAYNARDNSRAETGTRLARAYVHLWLAILKDPTSLWI